MPTVGALVACLVTGYLITKIGRKTTMLVMSPPFVLGWLLVAFARNVPMMIAGRWISGKVGGLITD